MSNANHDGIRQRWRSPPLMGGCKVRKVVGFIQVKYHSITRTLKGADNSELKQAGGCYLLGQRAQTSLPCTLWWRADAQTDVLLT